MTRHARGAFEVKMVPLDGADQVDGITVGRMSLDKQFTGDLEAEGKGQMLTAMTGVEGSAVYVAIERVTGTLQDRSGSFVLHHRGVMDRGAQELSIRIVPDSGAGELAGIAGEMTIAIADGRHAYDLAYTLPDKR